MSSDMKSTIGYGKKARKCKFLLLFVRLHFKILYNIHSSFLEEISFCFLKLDEKREVRVGICELFI